MAEAEPPAALSEAIRATRDEWPGMDPSRATTRTGPWEPDVAPWRRNLDRTVSARLDALVGFLLARWALLVSLGSALVVLGAYLTPLLMHLGYADLGQALFTAYSYVCAQTPEHSYFLWGYQAAIDHRLTALYGAVALAGLAYYRWGVRVRPLGWRLYVLLILPLALDGFTQAFGWRQSTWELRTLTGALTGAGTVWLLYPRLNRALSGTRAKPAEHPD